MEKVFQLHPTLLCNRVCSWCAYETKDLSIPFERIKKELVSMKSRGYRILKISGGGEPLAYPHIIDVLKIASALKYQIFLQTNGDLLNDEIKNLCDDIRISFGDGIPFSVPTILPHGFSYVVSAKPDYNNLNTLLQFAGENNLYVRVTQDDTDMENVPDVEEIKENVSSDIMVFKPGTPEYSRLKSKSGLNAGADGSDRSLNSIWDAKSFHRGENPCPSCESPLLGADGYWYPCCKTHCAGKEIVKGYNEKMRLGKSLLNMPYDGSNCVRCYY